jgi:hypothetical protein
MFYCADDQAQAYQELWDEVPGAVRVRGFAYVVNDVFGFLNIASLTITDEIAFIYRNRQVRADKLTGTGEAILHGQKVYATLGSNFQSVTANPSGTIGTDYYFCGVAKKDAGADEETVLIDFWGDEYDHTDRAA